MALFPDSISALSVRDRLIESGVSAEVHYDVLVQRLWFISKKAAGVRVDVPCDQLERATLLMRKWVSTSKGPRDAIRCPECKSWRVDYPQYTPKSFLTNLAIGLMAEFHVIERQYYCEECHCMWSKPEAGSHRARSHQSPNYFIEGIQHRGGEPGSRPRF